MRGTVRILAALGTLALVMAPWATPARAASTTSDWISVTKVMVDRLGGVNVSGRVSCAGAYQALIDGALSYQDEDGQWATIPWQEGDLVVLQANNDNYTVTQPAGRKTTIQLTHESSYLTPCYHDDQLETADGGFLLSTRCSNDGTSCAWETDHYGYDRDADGPLFDYSETGKFKAGLLSVKAESIGLLVQINREGSWLTYYVAEGSYAFVSASIKAVKYS